MEITDIIEFLPYIVPGFLFLMIYKNFRDTKDEPFEITLIGSIVFSFIFTTITKTIVTVLGIPYDFENIINIVLVILSDLIIIQYQSSSKYKEHMITIGKTTGSEHIWYDFFDMSKGTRVQFYTQYQFKDVIIQGNIRFFEKCKDSHDCVFIIDNYIIKTLDGKSLQSKENERMIFNTKDIHGLQAIYGK